MYLNRKWLIDLSYLSMAHFARMQALSTPIVPGMRSANEAIRNGFEAPAVGLEGNREGGLYFEAAKRSGRRGLRLPI